MQKDKLEELSHEIPDSERKQLLEKLKRDQPDEEREAVSKVELPKEERERLIMAYDLCWKVQMVSKLLTDKPLEPEVIGEGGRALLLHETSEPALDALLARLGEATQAAAKVIDAVLARNGATGEAQA